MSADVVLFKAVPLDPTEEQWGGLARSIMMWMDMSDGPKLPRDLLKHLERSGVEIPQWLRDEPEMLSLDHSMSKGSRCVLIYKAMLFDAPKAGGAAVEDIKALIELAEEAEPFIDEFKDHDQILAHGVVAALPALRHLLAPAVVEDTIPVRELETLAIAYENMRWGAFENPAKHLRSLIKRHTKENKK